MNFLLDEPAIKEECGFIAHKKVSPLREAFACLNQWRKGETVSIIQLLAVPTYLQSFSLSILCWRSRSLE